MRIGMELRVEQRQKLVMTPQLRLAMQVLQMPMWQLRAAIERECASNPLLEALEPPSPEPEGPSDRELEILEFLGDYDEAGGPIRTDGEAGAQEFTAEAPMTLVEYLEDQLRYRRDLSRRLRDRVRYLVHCLDDRGYLAEKVADGEALRVLQSLDPPGVGARDLAECLALQLERRGAAGADRALVRSIVSGYLAELAAGRYSYVAQSLGVEQEDVRRAAEIIRTLDPKPGRCFGGGPVAYVVPEATVFLIDDEPVVVMNEDVLPTVRLNRYYRQLLAAGDLERGTREYLRRQLKSALWFMRCIQQRGETLRRVIELIMLRQKPFLKVGVSGLKPLTLKDVAYELEVHESTVSRATAGKYVQTPCGTFPLSYFFSPGLSTDGGSAIAATAVKRLIREIVGREDKASPLSDSEISEALARMGIRVARRTVAKYRNQLGIPSAALRCAREPAGKAKSSRGKGVVRN